MPSISEVPQKVETCTFPEICHRDSDCNECAEIREANKQIPCLEERKGAAISRINTRRDLLTTRFPLEIVSNIFEEYVKLDPRHSEPLFQPLYNHLQAGISRHFSSFSPRGPLNLGAVCRLWRNIAWSHSPLWNNLYIDLSRSGHEHEPEIIREWLARSRVLPLDIRISDGHDINFFGQSHYAIAIMNIIKQFSSRWRSLDIRIERSDIMYRLEDSFFSDHQSTSILKRLSLVGDTFEVPFEKLLHPNHWTRLSHLHITETHVKSLRWMLERISESSSPFTHLSVERMSGTEEDNLEDEWKLLSQSVIRLPTLLALAIGRPTVETLLSELFDHLDAPALRSLKSDLTGRSCVSSFMSFVSRSGCSLKELIISDYDDLALEPLSALLRAHPALEDLTLSLSNIATTLFTEVLSQHNFRTTNTPILPNLRRLNIEVWGFAQWRLFVGIYIEDPSSFRHPKDRSQTQIPRIPRPGRESLQLVFCQRVRRQESCLIDITSLVAFAYLWQQYGVRIQVQLQDQMYHEETEDLLVPSYCQSSYYDDTQSEDAILTSLKQLAALPL